MARRKRVPCHICNGNGVTSNGEQCWFCGGMAYEWKYSKKHHRTVDSSLKSVIEDFWSKMNPLIAMLESLSWDEYNQSLPPGILPTREGWETWREEQCYNARFVPDIDGDGE